MLLSSSIAYARFNLVSRYPARRSVMCDLSTPARNNAVFIHSTQHLGDNVARAATAHGLAPAAAVQFVASLLSQNKSALNNVPGITTSIIDASTGALLDPYAGGFRWVWFCAAAFSLVAAIASAFLSDPSSEFNERIDAPLRETR